MHDVRTAPSPEEDAARVRRELETGLVATAEEIRTLLQWKRSRWYGASHALQQQEDILYREWDLQLCQTSHGEPCVKQKIFQRSASWGMLEGIPAMSARCLNARLHDRLTRTLQALSLCNLASDGPALQALLDLNHLVTAYRAAGGDHRLFAGKTHHAPYVDPDTLRQFIEAFRSNLDSLEPHSTRPAILQAQLDSVFHPSSRPYEWERVTWWEEWTIEVRDA